MNRFQQVFRPISSSSPGFNSTSGPSQYYALESTALNRFWNGPSGRALRVASISGDDFYVQFGTTSSMTVGTTCGVLILGGTVESFAMMPYWTHIGIAASTDVICNMALGYGF